MWLEGPLHATGEVGGGPMKQNDCRRGRGQGTGRGPCCAFLPEGPVRLPETWAGGQQPCRVGVMLCPHRVKESPPEGQASFVPLDHHDRL